MAMVLRKRRNEGSVLTGTANSRRSKKLTESTEKEMKGWYNIEPEVLAIVFKFLEWPERFKLERVCRHWRNVIESKQFLNVGVLMWYKYSKHWPKLSFDKLIYNLVVVRQKIITGINISSSSNESGIIDSFQLTGGMGLIRSWDHFKVVRLRDVNITGSLVGVYDSLINVILRQAFNLEELVVVLRRLLHYELKIDLSSFQYLKKIDLINCFLVNPVSNCITTLSIAGGGMNNNDFDYVTDVLIKCASTLRTLKICDVEVVASLISTNKKSILFPRLEYFTINAVNFPNCDLKIDLTEAKLKQFNYADCTDGEVDIPEYLVNFNVIQNVLSNQIESLNIRLLYSQTIVSIMDQMKGTCYAKLCHVDLAVLEGKCNEMESESILISVLGFLDNVENLNYIRLQNVIWSSKQLISLLMKIKYLQRAFKVEVGTIDDEGTLFWGKLVEQLTIEKIDSNDCDNKIEVNCMFSMGKVKNNDLIGLLKQKYNIYCVGGRSPLFDYSSSSDSSD